MSESGELDIRPPCAPTEPLVVIVTASISPKKQAKRKQEKKTSKLRSDLSCAQCARNFARRRDMYQHVKRAIHCWCGYFAMNQDAWARHVQHKHSGGAPQEQLPPLAGAIGVKHEPREARHVQDEHSGGLQQQQQPSTQAGPVDVKKEPQASGSASGVWWF